MKVENDSLPEELLRKNTVRIKMIEALISNMMICRSQKGMPFLLGNWSPKHEQRQPIARQNVVFLLRVNRSSHLWSEPRSLILSSFQWYNKIADKIEMSHIWGTAAYWTGHNCWVPPVGPVQQNDLVTDNSKTIFWHVNVMFFVLIDQSLFSRKGQT